MSTEKMQSWSYAAAAYSMLHTIYTNHILLRYTRVELNYVIQLSTLNSKPYPDDMSRF